MDVAAMEGEVEILLQRSATSDRSALPVGLLKRRLSSVRIPEEMDAVVMNGQGM